MPTLSDDPLQDKSKKIDPAAVQAEIRAILEPLKGWEWAYKNTSGETVSFERLHDEIRILQPRMVGLAFILRELVECACDLSVEHQEVLHFVVGVLQETEEKITLLWPELSKGKEAFLVEKSST